MGAVVRFVWDAYGGSQWLVMNVVVVVVVVIVGVLCRDAED